jgi:hypothetical protein
MISAANRVRIGGDMAERRRIGEHLISKVTVATVPSWKPPIQDIMVILSPYSSARTDLQP